jgi:hypothetical protein
MGSTSENKALNQRYVWFGAGCSTIVLYPYLEKDSSRPRGVIGMFDVSARPFVPKDVLTFPIPMQKFATMIENMEESFLITKSWGKLQSRIGSARTLVQIVSASHSPKRGIIPFILEL